ncbi:unnamed protein product [Toxocara canis]|uniref:BTB domain-containing protein n=1 Tax=Toxocara canis TaxID=6265 RepID=A0A183UPW4_TOXCA|nr:unnamed protein product [Toxocara canis]
MTLLINDKSELDEIYEYRDICDSVFIRNTRKLWREGVAYDFFFLLATNKKRFATHQLIFAAGSEYFRDYFFSMKPGDAGTSASRPFRVINISEETFEVMLNFLYSHQTMHPNLIPTDILLELLHAASQYKMQKLKLACICKIRNMSPEQCIPILQQAIFYKEVVIAERCLMVADENAETILNAESLLDSDSNVLEILIGRETFIPGSELRLFMALLSWSIAKCQRSGLDPSPQNERRVLGNLLNLVDFKALSNDELCDVAGKNMSGSLETLTADIAVSECFVSRWGQGFQTTLLVIFKRNCEDSHNHYYNGNVFTTLKSRNISSHNVTTFNV